MAARLYPAATVGLNSAILSAMMLVSGLAQLNMTTLLPRYLPVVGSSRRRLVGLTYAGTLVVTLVLATLAVAVLPRLIPTLGELRELSARTSVLFVAGALTFTIFSLQDSVLIGLRRAVWVPVENLTSALLRLALLPLFVGPLPRLGNHGFVDRGRRRRSSRRSPGSYTGGSGRRSARRTQPPACARSPRCCWATTLG